GIYLSCQIERVTDELAVLIVFDKGHLVVSLSEPGMRFIYAEAREFSELLEEFELSDAQKLASVLAITSPPDDEGMRFLIFIESVE
ncbi:MAG: hypothetical protein ABSG96_06500, partial [Terracidiphilus sp.]